jgi:serine/threonine protein kinase
MAITIGSRLGPYEIIAPLGAGGMGEVYRAHDAKLGRDVAIKILPDVFAADPERLARFEREAKTLAALNHPHIAQIYGFEESSGIRALVMELVEGPTLADRIAQGPVPIDEAVAIARQIADALEAAHDQGIVHRDLKPANIKVRGDGTVKVLDFGLAKALDPAGPSSAAAMNSPTLTVHATQLGMILGTAAYMAPEQARGRSADRRADIWAFGVVCFEMLTGKRAFEGEEISDTLASVLKEDPDWAALPPDLPASLRRLLRRCLEKDPHRRLSAIGDARLELDERDEIRGERPTVRAVPSRVPWIVAAAASLVGIVAVTMLVASALRSAAPSVVTRFSIVPSENTALYPDATTAVVSPDGRTVVLVTGDVTFGSASHLTGFWLRSVDSLKARPLAGTEGGYLPFWSPDSQQIAFFTTDRKLKKIAVDGGHIEEICDAPDGRGGTWSSAGTIVFAPVNAGPLMRVAAAGGTPEAATAIEAGRGETGHRFPVFLPDGDHFLYAAVPPRTDGFDIFIGALSGSSRDLLLSAAQSTPAFAEPGYLLFVRKGGLVVQRFDPRRRMLSGEPVSIEDAPGAVGDGYIAGPAVSASTNGTLAYLANLVTDMSLLWFDQSGRRTSKVVPAGQYQSLSVTRDGRRAVLVRWTSPTANDLWIADLDRGGASRFTNATGATQNAIWSPDGARVAFSANRGGPRDMYVKSAVSASAEEPLYRSKTLAKDPQSWSADGQFVVYQEMSPVTNWDVGPAARRRSYAEAVRSNAVQRHGRSHLA